MRKHPFTLINIAIIFLFVFLLKSVVFFGVGYGIENYKYIIFKKEFNIKNIEYSELFSKNNIKVEGNERLVSLLGEEINNTMNLQFTKIIPDNIESKQYKVKRGDNIWNICKTFGITPAELFKINNLKTEMLYTSQVLNIPIYNGRVKLPDHTLKFLWPVNGWISSAFGPRQHPIYKRWDFHDGIDIVADKYTPIRSSEDGIVVFAGRKKYAGNNVIVEHIDGFSTYYAHCSEVLVKKGDLVSKGDYIARVGKTGVATGYHVHFGMKLYGTSVNPVQYLKDFVR